MSYKDAIKAGALAFFDEKYEEESISFARRVIGKGGYHEIQSNVETSQVNMLKDLTDEEFFELFEEF